MKMIITGSDGMLGREAMTYFSDKHHVVGIDRKGYNGYACDITEQQDMEKIFEKEKPNIVLHCAALIDVDYCQKHPEIAYHVNVKGTKIVSELCRKYNAKLIYISTSMVFDGVSKAPYSETDRPNPLNTYASTKNIGEWWVEMGDDLIIRTNIIGLKEGSYFDWIYNKIKNNEEVGCYSDINFNAMYVKDFVKYIAMLIDNNKIGYYNITSRNWVSKYQFAVLLSKAMHEKGNIKKTQYISNEIQRPKNAVLNCAKFEKEFNLKLPTIEETIEKVLKDKI